MLGIPQLRAPRLLRGLFVALHALVLLICGCFVVPVSLLLPQGCVQEVWAAREQADVGLPGAQHGHVLCFCR